MSIVSFDTLNFAQMLRDKAAVPQPQAERISKAFDNSTGEQIAQAERLVLLIRGRTKRNEELHEQLMLGYNLENHNPLQDRESE
jgi:hypothetical protein